MKTLILIRHAKSSWDDPSLDDFDRPLNHRGATDAPMMGKRLRKRELYPELMISSTARRARTTAVAIADALEYPQRQIHENDMLYHASPETILKVLQATSDSIQVLYVFGHNPGFTDFANRICASYIDNIVTCGQYALQLYVDHWKEVRLNRKAELLFYDYPKKK